MKSLILIFTLIIISINISHAWVREKQLALGLYEDNPRREDGTFDYRICKYSAGHIYEECKDLEMEKDIGKYWREIKQFWFDFQMAIKNDDKQKLAGMMHYPLNVYYQPNPIPDDMIQNDREMLRKKRVIKDEQEFIKEYNFIFNPIFKKQIIKKEYLRISIRKNHIKFIDFYTTVVMNKECDFSKTTREECPYVKVKYITNDAIKY